MGGHHVTLRQSGGGRGKVRGAGGGENGVGGGENGGSMEVGSRTEWTGL
jgi:hypothetical protein